MSRVALEGVTGRYGDNVALKELDLRIEEGEFLTLLGPSGCGKTTTLRLIAGFLPPAAGRIYFDDEEVSRRPPNKRQIGMVFQDYALFPHMTVADNIGFGLTERGASRRDVRARADELLELVRLPGMQDRFPSELSGGQRQRVALARAVAYLPRVLLMDEPLGALDLKLREAMQVEIRRIQRELDITTVYVTHDQTEAMNMSDRIAVMSEGELMQLAGPQEMYNRPQNKFVADFIGKINFLPVSGVRVAGCGGLEMQAAGHTVRLRSPGEPASARNVLALRPEHLSLRDPDAIPTGNSVSGTVAAVSFWGNFVRVDVDIGQGTTLVVEARPDDRCAETGRPVLVVWDVDRGHLLPED